MLKKKKKKKKKGEGGQHRKKIGSNIGSCPQVPVTFNSKIIYYLPYCILPQTHELTD